MDNWSAGKSHGWITPLWMVSWRETWMADNWPAEIPFGGKSARLDKSAQLTKDDSSGGKWQPGRLIILLWTLKDKWIEV